MRFFILFIVLLFSIVNGKDDFSTFPTNMHDYIKKFKTEQPIIAITTMFTENKTLVDKFSHSEDSYYVAASYVKLLELSGARVVPLFNRHSDKELYSLLESTNGALLGGGDADVQDSGYRNIATKVLNYAMKKKREGVHWPVMGICRGAQMMMVSVSKDFPFIETDAKNYTVPLDFPKDFKESRMFGSAPEGVIETLKTKPITFNAHVHGIDPIDFFADERLKSFYRVTSTNKDRDGFEFVSTYEAYDYPFYGLQWHPEKILYVHNPNLAIAHSTAAIRVSHYISNFFTAEAKLNANKFPSLKEEQHHLIYRWNPVYTGDIRPDTPYEQMYLIHREKIIKEHHLKNNLSKADKAFIDRISEL